MTADAGRRALFLRLEAPFAAFRWLQAGVYRATSPVIPPSAAWGLALNLASIETRGDLNQVVTSIRPDAPHLDIAIGVSRWGTRATLYQQLHTYPVGNSGKELKAKARGQKYWVAPTRRELLVDLECVIGVRGDAAIVDRISQGLAGTLDAPRYGLPFAGDNQFLFSRIDPLPDDARARWFVPLAAAETGRESFRLTKMVDRVESSNTVAPLFAPTEEVCACPDQAWIDVGPAARE